MRSSARETVVGVLTAVLTVALVLPASAGQIILSVKRLSLKGFVWRS